LVGTTAYQPYYEKTMINWRAIPFVRLAIPLLLGIAVASSTSYSLPIPFWMWVVLATALFVATRLRVFRYRWVYGVTVFVFLFLMGLQRSIHHNELNKKDHFQQYISEDNLIIGTIVNTPVVKKQTRVYLEVESIQSNDQEWTEASGNLLLYLESDTTHLLAYGDQLAISSLPRRIEKAKNPEALDFQKIYHFQNLHYQAFAKRNDWKILNHDRGNLKMGMASRLRIYFIQTLNQYLGDTNEFGIASALVLGYKNELSPEIKEAYANTGAIHILAVSGMHVGVLLFFLKFLLNLVRLSGKRWEYIKLAILLGVLWLYALLTGMPPSVVRAVFMFTVFEFGYTTQRQSNIYNSIFFSAFCILVYNPYFLMQVGFQLSYLAVIGIVYFYPKIYRKVYFKNRAVLFLWQLTSVSLAAQLATFPLGLYYFHQFPSSFIFSGWIAVSMAPVILGGGLLLLAFSWFPLVASLLGGIIFYAIQFLNACIFFIEKLPASVIEGIWITVPLVWLLYLLIISIVYILERNNLRWAMGSLSIIFLMAVSFAFTQVDRNQQQQIVIYQIYKNTLIDFFDQKKLTSVKSIELDSIKEAYAAQNYRWRLKSKNEGVFHLHENAFKNRSLSYEKPFIQFQDYRLAVIDAPLSFDCQSRIKVQRLLVINSPKINIEELTQCYDFEEVVFDGSNKKYRVDNWKAECESMGINYHDTAEDGALIIDLRGEDYE